MNISNINFCGNTVARINPGHIKERCMTARDAYDFPRGMTIDKACQNNTNIKRPTPEQLFDIQYASGTRLSDGSTLIRPVILSLGKVDILPSEDEEGKYIFSRMPIDGCLDEPVTTEMTEEELLNNKSLCRGKLKKNGNKIILSFTDREGNTRVVYTDKAGCIKTLKDNLLYL